MSDSPFFSTFKAEDLSSLLSFKPAINNLYTIQVLSGDETATDYTNYTKLHATSITLNEESIAFSRHPVTKTFYLGDSNVQSSPFTRVDEVTISWREDINWSVKKFHEDWLALFYNKDADTYLSYDNAEVSKLYKTFVVTFPIDNGKIKKVTLHDVLPTSTGSLNLAWSDNPTLVTHTLTYKLKGFTVE